MTDARRRLAAGAKIRLQTDFAAFQDVADFALHENGKDKASGSEVKPSALYS